MSRDYDITKKLYKGVRNKLFYTLRNRAITLVLLSITLTPLPLFLINGYIESLETLILSIMIGGIFLIGHHYHKDETMELEDVYIDLETIKKVRRIEKEYR